ncbi:MAG: DUF3987 domain-containing protein [Rhodospirillales bacterium]|nr:DUF3987 domain-containing protein [Rhodospirillales bacterium]
MNILKKLLARVPAAPLPPFVPADREAPRPLVRCLPDALPFPILAVGRPAADVIAAIEEISQAPTALCAQSVIASAALALQGHADVVLPTHAVRPLSQNLISIAASGERKSTVDDLATRPIKVYQDRLRDQYAADMRICLKQERESRRAAVPDDAGEPAERPLFPNCLLQEPTFEALCRMLCDGQPSVGLFSDEGGRFLSGYSMKPEERLKTFAGLSKFWDGDAVTRERVKEPPSILAGKRVSVHLLVQPGVSSQFLGDATAMDQGILSRCLVSAPPSRIGSREFRPASDGARQILHDYERRLLEILSLPLSLRPGTRNELALRPLPLSAAAERAWIAFVGECERLMRPDGDYSDIRGLASKLGEHAARLAGVITLFSDFESGDVNAEAMDGGIALARFYALEAKRLFGAVALSVELQAAQRTLEWLQGRWDRRTISLVELYQRGPNAIRDKKSATRIARILEDHGWLVRASNRSRTPEWLVVR